MIHTLLGVMGVAPNLKERVVWFQEEVTKQVVSMVNITRPVLSGSERVGGGKGGSGGLFCDCDSHFVTWIHPSVVKVVEWLVREKEEEEGVVSLCDLIVV